MSTILLTVTRDPYGWWERDPVLPSACVATWLRDDSIPDGTVFCNGRCYVAREARLWPSDADGNELPGEPLAAYQVERLGEPQVRRADVRWLVLEALTESERICDIAERLGKTKSGIGNHTRRLERDGLLTSEPDPEHNNHKIYTVTDAGLAALAEWSKKLERKEMAQ